ncbi:NAD(P)-binding protein [Methylogaea oryzae]|uniref:NAD(P)-binding protein n=1 Tax=Methylogaea oryzae TaxID=1295382 RepID=UPI0020D1CF6F|nr:NAD(P)-binding protein [Methylogaea oryzae]
MNQPHPSEHYPVIIVGGGQAGLSMSYQLQKRDIRHIVFEKNRIGHSCAPTAGTAFAW